MKSYKFTGWAIVAAILIVLPSWASADLFVGYNFPQTTTVTYDLGANSASGTSIVMTNFVLGGATITGATLSFNFTGGAGWLSVSYGGNNLFSTTISGANIVPLNGGTYYQILGFLSPSTSGSPLYTFDDGQFNVTFRPIDGNPNSGRYTGGYFQVFGEKNETPLPAAFILFGSGLFGLVCIRRRKK